MPFTSIDKIKLQTEAFNIQSALKNGLLLTTTKTGSDFRPDPETGIPKRSDYSLTSHKATFNNGLQVDIDSANTLIIQCSPNRILTGNHHEPRPYQEFPQSIETIVKTLNENHIDVDLTNTKISRLDLARQNKFTHSIESYVQAFANLGGNRNQRVAYEKGYYWESPDSEFIIYDKSFHAYKKFKEKIEPNILRGEFRVLTQQGLNRIVKFNTLDQIKNVNMDNVYDNYTQNRLFKNANQIFLFPHDQQIQYFIHHFKNDALREYASYLIRKTHSTHSYYQTLINAIPSEEIIRKLFVDKGGMHIRSYQRQIKKLKEASAIHEAITEGETPYSLTQEIKTKFSLTA